MARTAAATYPNAFGFARITATIAISSYAFTAKLSWADARTTAAAKGATVATFMAWPVTSASDTTTCTMSVGFMLGRSAASLTKLFNLAACTAKPFRPVAYSYCR